MNEEINLWAEKGHPVIYLNGKPLEKCFFYIEDAFKYFEKMFPDITGDELRAMESGEPYEREGDAWEIK